MQLREDAPVLKNAGMLSMLKAISPMVAVVLLIAFTIGVGGLISTFVTGLTKTSTGITGNQSEALARCGGAWINVNSVQNTTVLYSNPNQVTITSVILVFDNGNTVTGDTSMTSGESSVTSISTGMVSSNFTTQNGSLTLRGLCQATVTVEGRCTSIQSCWDV